MDWKLDKKQIITGIVAIGVIVWFFTYIWSARSLFQSKGDLSDFYITQQEFGKHLIKNEEAGFSLVLPSLWKWEKRYENNGTITTWSPDIISVKVSVVEPPISQGCMMEIFVEHKKKNLEKIRKEILQEGESKSYSIKYDFKIKEIKNASSLVADFESSYLNSGRIYSIPLTNSGKVLKIYQYFGNFEEERCQSELKEFIPSLKIKE